MPSINTNTSRFLAASLKSDDKLLNLYAPIGFVKTCNPVQCTCVTFGNVFRHSTHFTPGFSPLLLSIYALVDRSIFVQRKVLVVILFIMYAY